MIKRLLYIAVLSLPLLISCKKSIDKKKADLVVVAMTTGRWYVEEYVSGGVNVTAEFDGYEFQFYADGKVDGIKSTSSTSGSWVGDASNMTITSNFPGAALPLKRLNALWKITDNDWVYVHANFSEGSVTNYLKLHKK